MKKLAVFVSGSGSNLESISEKIKTGKLTGAKIAVVICDKPGAFALTRCKNLGLEAVVIDRKLCKTRHEFEETILKSLDGHRIDLIVLAGFMRLLSAHFVDKWRGKILNIHPSYLPNFMGAHAIHDAWKAKASETGVTIHFVDEGMDTGKIILQERVKILSNDTLQTLEERIHSVEHELYPKAIQLVLDGKVKHD